MPALGRRGERPAALTEMKGGGVGDKGTMMGSGVVHALGVRTRTLVSSDTPLLYCPTTVPMMYACKVMIQLQGQTTRALYFYVCLLCSLIYSLD